MKRKTFFKTVLGLLGITLAPKPTLKGRQAFGGGAGYVHVYGGGGGNGVTVEEHVVSPGWKRDVREISMGQIPDEAFVGYSVVSAPSKGMTFHIPIFKGSNGKFRQGQAIAVRWPNPVTSKCPPDSTSQSSRSS